MKWGIAKVIANAEKTPVVLPFYHLGMEEVSASTMACPPAL